MCWRVKEEGIHLRRLIYLTEEEFKFLKILRFEFLRKTGQFFKKGLNRSPEAEKEPQGCPESEDDSQSNGNGYASYEATNIGFTWDSLYWSWRRVKEFHNSLCEDERCNDLSRQAKELACR